MEENDEEEKEPINIEITEQKAGPYNDENAIDFKWSDVTEEDEDDILWLISLRTCKSKLMRKIFKKVTGWLWYRTKWKEKLRRSFLK